MSTQESEPGEELSIPLLDDVIDPDELEFVPPVTSQPRPQADHELILEVLREGIAEQLLKDLRPIVSAALESTLTRVMAETGQLLRDELGGTLEQHLRQLIAEAVAREFEQRPGATGR